MGWPGTARNSNGPGRPEIQTIRAFSGLGRAGPGSPNVHLFFRDQYDTVSGDPVLHSYRLTNLVCIAIVVVLLTSSA
jgi:hypothetical protein